MSYLEIPLDNTLIELMHPRVIIKFHLPGAFEDFKVATKDPLLDHPSGIIFVCLLTAETGEPIADLYTPMMMEYLWNIEGTFCFGITSMAVLLPLYTLLHLIVLLSVRF